MNRRRVLIGGDPRRNREESFDDQIVRFLFGDLSDAEIGRKLIALFEESPICVRIFIPSSFFCDNGTRHRERGNKFLLAKSVGSRSPVHAMITRRSKFKSGESCFERYPVNCPHLLAQAFSLSGAQGTDQPTLTSTAQRIPPRQRVANEQCRVICKAPKQHYQPEERSTGKR